MIYIVKCISMFKKIKNVINLNGIRDYMFNLLSMIFNSIIFYLKMNTFSTVYFSTLLLEAISYKHIIILCDLPGVNIT